MAKRAAAGQPQEAFSDERMLLITVEDLFIAGMETTVSCVLRSWIRR